MTDEWNEIQAKVTAYRKLKAEADALEAEMKVLRAELMLMVEAHAYDEWVDDEGYARLNTRRPYMSYNSEALEALYWSVREAARMLDPHHTENPGYTYLQVK